MQTLIKDVLAKVHELEQHYPQKVAYAFLSEYADINKIRLPAAIEDERCQKLARVIKTSLSKKTC